MIHRVETVNQTTPASNQTFQTPDPLTYTHRDAATISPFLETHTHTDSGESGISPSTGLLSPKSIFSESHTHTTILRSRAKLAYS